MSDFVGIDKLSLLDYEEKISVVLFSKECNFRCPFCHNGESVLNATTTIPFNEILDFLKKRKGVMDAVVISGGEPTLMNDLKEKIIEIKKLGYLIKLDTNGSNPEIIKDLLNNNLLDYIAMDIKNSFEKYPLITACKNVNIDHIKESINIIQNSNINYEFRTTLVDEFFNKDDIIKMSEFLKGSKVLYLQKFVEREGVIQKGLHEVPIDIAKEYQKILSSNIKKVELRGY